MTKFFNQGPDGRLVQVRDIPQSAMLKCPHCIMVADHYRMDNSCRCDDRHHSAMKEWGYLWNNDTDRWDCPPETEEDS